MSFIHSACIIRGTTLHEAYIISRSLQGSAEKNTNDNDSTLYFPSLDHSFTPIFSPLYCSLVFPSYNFNRHVAHKIVVLSPTPQHMLYTLTTPTKDTYRLTY